jgi:murein DD-endopeptidase MepM/ murein hydrolase activator NlpD
MSWGTPQWDDEASAWAADYGDWQQSTANPSSSPWWSSSYSYAPSFGASDPYLPTYGNPADTFRPLSTYTTQILVEMADQYARKTYPELYQPPQLAGPSDVPNMARPTDPSWMKVNEWDALIRQYTAQVADETGVNVPGNVIKAVMQIESGGDPRAYNSASGATGPMQVTASTLGNGAENGWDYTKARSDPNYALYAGIKELALRYMDGRKLNTNFGWSNAVGGYNINDYNANTDYIKQFEAYLNELNALSTPQAGEGGFSATPGTKQWQAIWGGTPAPITQEFGPTPFAASHAHDWYKFVTEYGLAAGSHPGIDVGVGDGTRLYSPVAGTVITAGGTDYYQDDRFLAQPQTGDLRIRLANGDELLLGHMSGIDVHVGDTIQAGQLVGTSGIANGAHVHVEYRQADPSLPHGQRIVDPRIALGGGYSGQYLGEDAPGYGGVTLPTSATWQNYLAAAASGQPLVIGQGERMPTGTFTDYLLQAMGLYKPPEPQARTATYDWTGGGLTNAGTANGWNWSTLDGMNSWLQSASDRYYNETGIKVPPNLIKGLIAREGSFGNDFYVAYPRGYANPVLALTGVFKETADSRGIDWNRMVTDKAYAVYAATKVIGDIYREQGGQYGWEGAAATYFTGDPLGLSDPEGSSPTSDYLYGPNGVVTHWHNLDALYQSQQG